MRRCALIALIVFLTAAFAYGKDYEVKGKAGNYSLEVLFDKNPSVKGEHRLEINIMDAAMKPVTDATVIVKYLMPTLGNRPPMMEYETAATREGTAYKALVNLSMVGEWTFIVEVTRAGKTEAMKFSFFVR